MFYSCRKMISTENEKILETVCTIYQTCKITELPVDCFNILKQYGFRVFTYSELKDENPEIFELCCSYTTDSFRWKNIIGYNERTNSQRIRFSLMHEFGHAILETNSEILSDEFASHILAPRILIHKYGYRTADQIHDAFGLSYAASNRVLASYKNWLRVIASNRPRTPSEPELQLERMFFPPKIENSPKPVIEKEEQEKRPLDSAEKYLVILRIINMGIPIPPEYKKDVQWYKRNEFRLK